MRIVGHGIDLADVHRMGQLLSHLGEAAVERQFTPEERFAAPPRGARRAAYFAGRFAAKEAVLKSLGVGFARGATFVDVEVVGSANSLPRIVLHGEAAAVAARLGIRGWMLSIAHGGQVAVASAIAVDVEVPAPDGPGAPAVERRP